MGTGEDGTIAELVLLLKQEVGYQGEIVFNHSKPDGTMQKLLDVSKIHALGWHHGISLQDGIKDTYCWFQKHSKEIKRALGGE